MFTYPSKYDVIVVGGGHAGIEAALAVARMGGKALILTANLDTIGKMPCNPAIGGLGKSHLVREIDALGGAMGITADLTGVQFRVLNRSKGPAVWSTRVQCDKVAYQLRMKSICESTIGVDVKQEETTSILHRDQMAYGVETSLNVRYKAPAVVLTTGTFLKGLIHIGSTRLSGGRSGELPSVGLSSSLRAIGFEIGRLKTGTPPRICRSSVDFSKTEVQLGDHPIPYLTYWKEDLFHVEQEDRYQTSDASLLTNPYPPQSVLRRIRGQLPCYLTFTTRQTADIVKKNLSRSAMYSGRINGVGPRYCPSVEDKIVRFPEKDRHQIFLEPEGAKSEEIYVNGLSTSLPFEVQVDLIRTVSGCERAEIMRPAYAIEYDFVFPTQLLPTLESKICRNLFLAGQINGTSGYEEAAAQGIVAGINALRSTQGLNQIVLARNQAYIGVLIDDLVTKGTVEPYRMFTSRAEHRLLLRQDNADFRLCEIGQEIGSLPEKCYRAFLEKKRAVESELNRLNRTRCASITLAQLLRRPELTYASLPSRNDSLSEDIVQQVEIAVKYDGYISRQEAEVKRMKGLESKQIPTSFDYGAVPSLRLEARQKLKVIRPATLGQAQRISGVSPADIAILAVWLKRHTTENNSEERTNGPTV